MYAGEVFGRLSLNEVVCLVRRYSFLIEFIIDFQIVLLRYKILNVLVEIDWDLWDVEEFTLDVSSEYDELDDEYWQFCLEYLRYKRDWSFKVLRK